MLPCGTPKYIGLCEDFLSSNCRYCSLLLTYLRMIFIEAFVALVVFYKDFLQFGSSGGQLGQNSSNHVIWFVDYQGHF